MIIQDACIAYSKMEHYNCKGNFETLARCACRVTVKRCTFLCHGGRGNNKLCGMCDDLDKASNKEDEESTKDHVNTQWQKCNTCNYHEESNIYKYKSDIKVVYQKL